MVIVCKSQGMTCLFAKVTSRCLHEMFLKLQHLQQENHQHTQSKMSKTRLLKAIFIKKNWLKSFNNGFVYNRVGLKRFWRIVSRQYTQFFHKLSTRASKLGGAMGGCFFRNILPFNVPKYNGGKFNFFDKKLSKSTSTYSIQPGLYTSITDIVDALNMFIQESNNHNETCITVKFSRRTQKVVFMLANDSSGLAFSSTHLGHFFGNNWGKQFGVLMKRKGPHKPQFAYDIVRIHSLMIYSDLVEYSIVGDTKAPLLRCFPFISKLMGGDIITTGEYMNYQTFSNLQFRPLLKNSFHSIHIDLRNPSGEKLLFVSVGITRLVLMFRKASNIHF